MRLYKAPAIKWNKVPQIPSAAIENSGKLINHCANISNVQDCVGATHRVHNSLKSSSKESFSLPAKAYIYAPFFNKDMIEQAVEANTSRVLQGKAPYPILSSDPEKLINSGRKSYADEKKRTFKNIEPYRLKFKKYLNKVSINNLQKISPVEVQKLGELLAFEQTEILPLNKANCKLLEKIYVVGHGAAGGVLLRQHLATRRLKRQQR